MKKNITKTKMPIRYKINIAIFALVALIFAFAPNAIIRIMFPNNDDVNDYSSGDFAYILYDVCPCHEGEDSCSGYFACGPDKANITYNLDNAPEDRLDDAKRMSYIDNAIESARQSAIIMRVYILCDVCYLMAFVSLVGGIIYWNHCAAKSKQ